MRLLISLIFAVSLFSCTATKHQKNWNDIIGINYIVKFPIVIGDKQVVDMGNTTPIYYYHDIIIYQLPYIFDSTKHTYHVKSDSISDENILTETRYNYFVYRSGSRYGIWYRSAESDSNKRLSVDSALSTKGTPINLQSIIYSPNDSLIEKLNMNNGTIFIEKYIPKTKPDESYNDTTLLYYSKEMKPIKFSLSPYLDSLRDAKLFKVQLTSNETYSQKYSITMPKRDLVYAIETLTTIDKNKLKTLLQRFQRDEKALLQITP